MNAKILLSVEAEVEIDEAEYPDLTVKKVLDSVILQEDDVIDGFDITTSLGLYDRTSDFFLKNGVIRSRKIVSERMTAPPDKEIDLLVTATAIAQRLAAASTDDITDSSGYFVVKEFGPGYERAVDVHKTTEDGNSSPHYCVYALFEDETCEYYYTKDLSLKGLLRALEQIAEMDVE